MRKKVSKQKNKSTGIAEGYLHGYSTQEQARLIRQARFLEPSVYDTIDYSGVSTLIEVGCGVGAQTEILLRRYPHLKVTGIDASSAQIKTARKRLKKEINRGKVRLDIGDALHLPYKDNSFEGAFICWFLEHVQEPVKILRDLHRVLKPSAVVYCDEVLNATFYIHPYSPATLQYWFAFNDHQWNLKGDPFVGAKLANYLLAAKFQNVQTFVKTHFWDNRNPKKRSEFIEYWTELLLSGAPGLISAGRVTPELVDEMRAELERLKDAPDSVIFYSWIQARAQAL